MVSAQSTKEVVQSKEAISEEDQRALLIAGMSARSAQGQKPWHFIAIDDKAILDDLSAEGLPELSEAPLAVLVCADVNRIRRGEFFSQDCAAAAQAVATAADALGLEADVRGLYPGRLAMAPFTEALRLPHTLVPHSIVVLGKHCCALERPAQAWEQSMVGRNGAEWEKLAEAI